MKKKTCERHSGVCMHPSVFHDCVCFCARLHACACVNTRVECARARKCVCMCVCVVSNNRLLLCLLEQLNGRGEQ